MADLLSYDDEIKSLQKNYKFFKTHVSHKELSTYDEELIIAVDIADKLLKIASEQGVDITEFCRPSASKSFFVMFTLRVFYAVELQQLIWTTLEHCLTSDCGSFEPGLITIVFEYLYVNY